MDTMHPGAEGSSTEADSIGLLEHQRHLQNLLMVTLIALIIMGAGLALFIAKQMRMVQQQVAEQRPTVQRMTADYQRTSEPLIRNFAAAMLHFATTNADFRPIIEKYRPALSNYLGAVPASLPASGSSNR